MKKTILASLLSIFFISNLFAQKKDSVSYFRNTVAVNPLSIVSLVAQSISKDAGGSHQGFMYKRNYNNNRNAFRFELAGGFSQFINRNFINSFVSIGHEWRKHSFYKFEHYFGVDCTMNNMWLGSTYRTSILFSSSYSIAPFVGIRYNLSPRIAFGYELANSILSYTESYPKDFKIYSAYIGSFQNSFALMYHL